MPMSYKQPRDGQMRQKALSELQRRMRSNSMEIPDDGSYRITSDDDDESESKAAQRETRKKRKNREE